MKKNDEGEQMNVHDDLKMRKRNIGCSVIRRRLVNTPVCTLIWCSNDRKYSHRLVFSNWTIGAMRLLFFHFHDFSVNWTWRSHIRSLCLCLISWSMNEWMYIWHGEENIFNYFFFVVVSFLFYRCSSNKWRWAYYWSIQLQQLSDCLELKTLARHIVNRKKNVNDWSSSID